MIAEATTYHVRFLSGYISTTVNPSGRQPVQLVAGHDGEVRQIRRGVADPCVDEEVAVALRAMRGWEVEPWPADFQPEERTITLRAGEALPGEGLDDAASRQRVQMLARTKVIGKAGRIDLPDMETENIALTQRVAELEAALQASEAERDTALMAYAKLSQRVEQEGRIHAPSLPRPGEDIPERHAPTAKEMGKGRSLAELRERGESGEDTWPDQGADDDDEVAAATAGALSGIGVETAATKATRRKASREG